MTRSCRPWWRNCAVEVDTEILAIDRLEDRIAPLGTDVARVRELISTLELCHHKAEQWVDNILRAIGKGETTKGLRTRLPDQRHPVEAVWQNACAALSKWVEGCPAESLDLPVGAVPATWMLAGLGPRSPLKEWQVQRVIEKIQSTIEWAGGCDDPTVPYVWLLLGGGEYEVTYVDGCPERYQGHEDFWQKTVRTMIHDTVNGHRVNLSLALAIDMLMPCHWRFVENLEIVIEAIGGMLDPEKPFAACGRNICLLPIRRRMMVVSNTLRTFCGELTSNPEVDGDSLTLLGGRTDVKRWLAASLDKTIRLQLDPPDSMRAMSAPAGPDWIR